MQAAEMLCGTRVYHLVFLISLAIGYVHSYPFQTLPSVPGYIPVYIRHGDQPLEEINPALAEAFHENSKLKASNLAYVNGPTDLNLEGDEANKNNVEAIRVRKAEICPDGDKKTKEPEEKATKDDSFKFDLLLDTAKKVFTSLEDGKESPKKDSTNKKKNEPKFLDLLKGFKLSLSGQSSKHLSKEDSTPAHNLNKEADPVIVDRLKSPDPSLAKDFEQEDIPVLIIDDSLTTKQPQHAAVLFNAQDVTEPPKIVPLERVWKVDGPLKDESK